MSQTAHIHTEVTSNVTGAILAKGASCKVLDTVQKRGRKSYLVKYINPQNVGVFWFVEQRFCTITQDAAVVQNNTQTIDKDTYSEHKHTFNKKKFRR